MGSKFGLSSKRNLKLSRVILNKNQINTISRFEFQQEGLFKRLLPESVTSRQHFLFQCQQAACIIYISEPILSSIILISGDYGNRDKFTSYQQFSIYPYFPTIE